MKSKIKIPEVVKVFKEIEGPGNNLPIFLKLAGKNFKQKNLTVS